MCKQLIFNSIFNDTYQYMEPFTIVDYDKLNY